MLPREARITMARPQRLYSQIVTVITDSQCVLDVGMCFATIASSETWVGRVSTPSKAAKSGPALSATPLKSSTSGLSIST